MISRVQLSAFTLYCGLLAAVSLADGISHNSTRSNRGTVVDVDAEAIEYALIVALLGYDDELILEGAEAENTDYVMGAGDDSDIDWSISDKAECEKNGGTWVETPGLGGFCYMKIEGEPGPPVEPIEVPDVDLGDPPGWHSASLEEITAMENLLFGDGDWNDGNLPITPGGMDTRHGPDMIVRKKPGRTTFSK